ncbi:hypothetical protein D3C80_1855710 [compost metagenome]
MIDPLARRDQAPRGLFRFRFRSPPVAPAPVAFAALVHRMALDRADRAHAVGHLPAPARRSIWARISSI